MSWSFRAELEMTGNSTATGITIQLAVVLHDPRIWLAPFMSDNSRVVLITGITGQDVSYLAELRWKKNMPPTES